MNMRIPKALRDKDPILGDAPQLDVPIFITEGEWIDEELDDFERQVEQELLEGAFIQECFEEMLAEEEAQWMHFVSNSQADTQVFVYGQVATHTVEQSSPEQSSLQVTYSKLNPEAPEFIPRGTAS